MWISVENGQSFKLERVSDKPTTLRLGDCACLATHGIGTAYLWNNQPQAAKSIF